MRKELRTLGVFLASPGDVSEERGSAQKVVDRLNEVIREPLGRQIILLGWEKLRPAYSRPQEFVNREAVAHCDLFVGVLHKRWGTPTGEYSSGFHEEYDLCFKRRQESSTGPEMWIYFKKLTSEDLSDVGPQLLKVLEFRRSIEDERKIFFHEFKNEETWREIFYDALLGYVMNLPSDSASSPQEATPPQPSSAQPSEIPAKSVEIDGSKPPSHDESEAQKLFARLNSELSAADANIRHIGIAGMNLEVFEVARLHLLTCAWIHDRTTDLVGHHHVNLLYKYKNKIHPSGLELRQIFWAMVDDSEEVVPGWFWFREVQPDAVRLFLEEILESGLATINLKSRALEWATICDIEVSSEVLPRLVGDELPTSQRVFNYLQERGTQAHLDILSKANSSGKYDDEALAAKVAILSRTNANEAFKALLEGETEASANAVTPIKGVIDKVESQLLHKAFEMSGGRLRRVAIKELARRNEVSDVELARMWEDDPRSELALQLKALNAPLARTEVEAVLKKPSPNPLVGAKLLASFGLPNPRIWEIYYRSQPDVTTIKADVRWMRDGAEEAYGVLASDHFAVFGETVRADLADDFRHLEQEYYELIKSVLGDEVEEWLAKIESRTTEYVRNKFMIAALDALIGSVKNFV